MEVSMFSMAGIAGTVLERGALTSPGWVLLLLLLLLTPPMVIYLTVRFRSWHELEAWGSHAGWIVITPFRDITEKMLHSHKPRHA
jgi:hypothetical protein